MAARLIVDELPAGYTSAQLRTLFASYGTVVSAVVVAGPLGESLRFGYVEMTTMEEAARAAAALDHLQIGQTRIHVSIMTIPSN
jgi:RNA recognition motif-containing protein